EGAMDKPMKLSFGELPGSVFVLIASTDAFTHGWDLAKATSQSTDLDPTVAGQLLHAVQQFLPDDFRGPDGQAPFGPRVEVPDSASAADRKPGPGELGPEARADPPRGQGGCAERRRVRVCGGAERAGDCVEHRFGDGHRQGNDA